MNILNKLTCKNRRVISDERFSKEDQKGFIALYDALVTDGFRGTINIPMIYDEAFPRFKELLGDKDFTNLMRYFGIGCKERKSAIKDKEFAGIIGKLRTIENAQYYLDGFYEVVSMYADMLAGAPDDMPRLVKAKLVRMYTTIWCNYHYFYEDYEVFKGEDNKPYFKLSYQRAERVNKLSVRPERLNEVYKAVLKKHGKDSILFDAIVYEFDKLDNKVKDMVLGFAELKYTKTGGFVSVNNTARDMTYNNVRGIKQRVHREVGNNPIEVFSFKTVIDNFSFCDIYVTYSRLTGKSLEDFDKKEVMVKVAEGSRIVDKPYSFYMIDKSLKISGQEEADRFIHLYESMVRDNTLMPAGFIDAETNEVLKEFTYAQEYAGAIKLVKELGIAGVDSPERELELAREFVIVDMQFLMEDYYNNCISKEDLLEALGDKVNFEIVEIPEVPGEAEIHDEEATVVSAEVNEDDICETNPVMVSHVNTSDILQGFVSIVQESDYVDLIAEEQLGYIEKVFVSGNESDIQECISGDISSDILFERMGMDEEFGEMYFDLKKVDITQIESKLMELKRKFAKANEMRRYSAVIKMYCYIMENNVACGPKNKVPKRNKSLKPANLMKAIA